MLGVITGTVQTEDIAELDRGNAADDSLTQGMVNEL